MSERTPDERAALRSALAVGLATAAYGVSFGALATASGLDVWQTCFLSLVMFTGGSQFALIGVLASGGAAAGVSAITGATLLGVRNAFYAVRMSPVVGPGLARRAAAAHLTIDESTAVATARSTLRGQRIGFWATGLAIYVGWNITTLIGALVGDLLGDVRSYGLDAAAAAAFLGLLWPRLRERQALAVAVGAAVVATALIPALPPGLPVLIAGAVAVLVGGLNLFASRPREEAAP
ncbi:branched-chain amino acid ABC transporter permease [Cnuibacter physcomitrellae]|uniref:Branched-chain amino acid ABC transporter permease n=1 Tax=Cnuibacter physcomitrellae TaxID=1619308 RepID=A0A1X9LK78_9MICO|nr:AzlC family ABC transporter permease [Cnuibacter physcomitrellae]ARJ05527.1 branched-chain amino acid ABC transporter permease [Cnuibacter physcomitrellae]MCS5496788.1 AzlC family ABC transporter permease [Cnuibacter physcomitrellae]GGI35890.1 branched-chain amino acid ABC transporter permease [Cnuibacter physcomitrellae]